MEVLEQYPLRALQLRVVCRMHLASFSLLPGLCYILTLKVRGYRRVRRRRRLRRRPRLRCRVSFCADLGRDTAVVELAVGQPCIAPGRHEAPVAPSPCLVPRCLQI